MSDSVVVVETPPTQVAVTEGRSATVVATTPATQVTVSRSTVASVVATETEQVEVRQLGIVGLPSSGPGSPAQTATSSKTRTGSTRDSHDPGIAVQIADHQRAAESRTRSPTSRAATRIQLSGEL